MTDNQKFIAGIAIGAATGAAIALFLSSERGRALLAQVKDIADDTTDDLKSKITSFEKEVKDILQKGKQFVADLESRAEDTIS